jgi:hypothetical protein
MGFKLGKEIFLKLNNGSVICEQESNIEVSNEGVLIRCKTTGDYGTRVEGGQKTGSIGITGAYRSDATGSDLSAFELIEELGKIHPAIWGGIETGDQIVTVDVQINNVSITATNDTETTFTATLDFAGDPVVTTVGAS